MKYNRDFAIEAIVAIGEGRCPNSIGLTDVENCQEHHVSCAECWRDALEQILAPSEEEAK